MPTATGIAGGDDIPRLELSWPETVAAIAAVETYFLATVSRAGSPHVAPVLAVWSDGQLMFNTAGAAKKSRNLRANRHCVMTAPGPDVDFVVEGTATLVSDVATLESVATAFGAKYDWWHPLVREGRFTDPDVGDPRDVFAIAPTVIFGFGKSSGFQVARWQLG